MYKRLKWLVLLAALAMVVVACGGSTTSETTAGGSPATTGGGGSETTAAPGSTMTSTPSGGGSAVDQTDGDLNFYNWSDYIDPDLVTAFEDQYGVNVVEDFYDSNETMLAQIQAGVNYDLIVPSDYMVNVMIGEDLLLPLQKDAIPNLANLDPKFTNLPYDPEGAYSVPYQWGTTGIGVDLSVVGENFDPSWALVLDADTTKNYPGGVSLLNDARETMGAALKYLGYSLNETSDDALQAAADVIAKDNVTVFDSDTFGDNLVNGEVSVAHGYSGDFFTAFDGADNPDNFEYIIPKEGATLWTDNMAVTANAEHPCTAQTFINFIMDAHNGAQLTNWTYYASPNGAAKEFIDPEVLDDPAIYPDEATFEKLEAIHDTGDAEIKFTDYFNQAKSG